MFAKQAQFTASMLDVNRIEVCGTIGLARITTTPARVKVYNVDKQFYVDDGSASPGQSCAIGDTRVIQLNREQASFQFLCLSDKASIDAYFDLYTPIVLDIGEYFTWVQETYPDEERQLIQFLINMLIDMGICI